MPTLRERVAWALVNKGVVLGQLLRRDEAIAALDSVAQRFGQATDAQLREQVARALFCKGMVLAEMKRRDEAVAVYDSVVQQFGDATEPDIQKFVALSRTSRDTAQNGAAKASAT